MKRDKMTYFSIITVWVVSILFMTSHVSAGELFADIDNDTRLESVQWRKIATNDVGSYYQMRVVDDNGRVIWKGPRRVRDGHPYMFSSTDFGKSMPELLYDINRDGYVELIAPEPQSDVRATFFRKLRWTGRTFEVLPSEALMMRNVESDYFRWVSGERTHGIWVSKFRRVVRRDLVKADVTYYDRNGVWSGGVALLKFTSEGAVVHRWIKPLFVKQIDTTVPPPNTSSREVPVTKTRIIGTVYGLDPNGDGFLSIRKKPRAEEIGRLYNGDRVEILGQNGKWYKIKEIKSRKVGWSHSNWIMID